MCKHSWTLIHKEHFQTVNTVTNKYSAEKVHETLFCTKCNRKGYLTYNV